MTILIDNFSIGIGDWTLVDEFDSFAVDVVDHSYSTSISGTYFIYEGEQKIPTFSGITDGYRIYYTPSGIYSDGTIDLTVHVENDNGETQEQNYYFLYGYHVEFDELVDWGFGSTVITKAEASNLAFCPNTEGIAFHFKTKDLYATYSGAVINFVRGNYDLNAAIYPRSVYSKTYTVTLSGIKDFAGNELAPFSFTFRTEDPAT
jgi:hypothetical protein